MNPVNEHSDPGNGGIDPTASMSEATQLPPTPPAATPSPSRRSRLAHWLFWSFAFVIATTASATLGALLMLMTPLPPVGLADRAGGGTDRPANPWRGGFQYRLTRPVQVLVMGIDRVPDVPPDSPEVFTGRSDTMLLLRFDPSDYSLSILSIPRDTQVEIPTIGLTKVNHANVLGGPALTARVVSRELEDIEIDRYIRVSTDALRELVDLLGGVEVFVPQAMSYTDVTQKLEINLDQGWQTLSGEQAEQFARFRGTQYGDIGRVQRQQMLLSALRQRITSPTVLPKLPEIVRLMQRYIDTNLSLEETLALVSFGLNLDHDSVRMVMLPGRFSDPSEFATSYWLVDADRRDRVLQIYFKVTPRRDLWQTTPTLADSREELTGMRIAVQNASGQPEVGHRVAAYLHEKGFDHVSVIEDWPDTLRHTQIIAQQGDLQGAERMKSILGLGQVEAASIGDIESEFTIRVGADWPEAPKTPLGADELSSWH
ncbi:LCP family protein [Trichothermofontia sp.]